MSDLASSQLLKASAAQLPVFTYFDPAFYELEQKILFADAPQYYGHELMVPNAGDYHTLDWQGHGKMLKNVDGDIKLISNVCRHRQALIYKGRGNGNHMVCNLHGWTYDAEGKLLATGEHLLIHVSLATRRAVAPTEVLQQRLREIETLQAALPQPGRLYCGQRD